MRAKILVPALLSLALLLPDAGFAQIGIRGGINLTDFVGDDAGDTDSKAGLNLGASFRILNFGPVAIVPEVYYAQKGAKRSFFTDPIGPESLNDQTTGEATFDLPYIEVPVLLRVALPQLQDGRFQPYLNAGPVFAWNLDCTVEFEQQGLATDGEDCDSLQSEAAFEETVRDYETGFTIGGGTDIVVIPGHGGLNLDVRYTRGLTRITEDPDGGDAPDVTNQAFTVMLGYSFGL